MVLESRVKKLEQIVRPENGKLTRDDWTLDEWLLFFSDKCSPELKEKYARTDLSITSKNTKKLEDFF
ncbi:MAG TPA: hypothetical protein PKV15_07135 [Syntrophomonadaceae bacterium]|nr:hypothetical protein [Syntrophomonadaceae bacterium]HPF44457.1 hypothetical protein [Syntrophomonadaceae bacterium]